MYTYRQVVAEVIDANFFIKHGSVGLVWVVVSFNQKFRFEVCADKFLMSKRDAENLVRFATEEIFKLRKMRKTS